MSEQFKDGGPAFPAHGSMGEVAWDGMSLRDYAAIHSTQPGVAEIVQAAGLGIDVSHRVFTSAEDTFGTPFNEWWGRLSLQEKCDLSAWVRYAQADAMLKARQP